MWDQNKALKLGWNTGNVWKTKINYNFSRNNSFEFKFIFISNGRVKQWEDGSNRKLNYVQLKELIEHNMKEGYLVTLNNINGNDDDLLNNNRNIESILKKRKININNFLNRYRTIQKIIDQKSSSPRALIQRGKMTQ